MEKYVLSSTLQYNKQTFTIILKHSPHITHTVQGLRPLPMDGKQVKTLTCEWKGKIKRKPFPMDSKSYIDQVPKHGISSHFKLSTCKVNHRNFTSN